MKYNMKSINILFGQGCDIDCIYCKRNYYHAKGVGSRTYEDIIKDIEENAIKHKKEDISFLFTGVGEPLMLPRFLDVCRKTRSLGISFSLETNGIKLEDFEFCKQLVDLGLERVSITFNSHIPEKYNEIVGGYNYFNDALKAFRNLEKLKIPVDVSIVILKQNLDHFYRIPLFIKQNFPKLKLERIVFHLVRINGPAEMFKDVAFKLSSHAKNIERSILRLRNEGFRIGFASGGGSFPFCFFPELVKEFNYQINKFNDDKMHVKTRYCKGCRYYDKCPGIASTYLELYDDSEFNGKAFQDRMG